MARHWYLFGADMIEFIDLGDIRWRNLRLEESGKGRRRLDVSEGKVELGGWGPVIRLGSSNHILPADLLRKLIDRFQMENKVKGTVLMEDLDHLEGYGIGPDESVLFVGDDDMYDKDLNRLYHYLPELLDPQVVEAIKMDPDLNWKKLLQEEDASWARK